MYIEGILRLTSPLHCAAPSDGGNERKNLTRTMRQKVITRIGIDSVPFFPANDIKGRLRRKAAAMVIRQIVTDKQKLTVPLYVGLTSGAVGGRPENTSTVEEINRARDNVYMGLFGGGVRMLRARLRVSDLVPVIASTIDAKLVPAAYAETTAETFQPIVYDKAAQESRPARGHDLIEEFTFFRVDDAARVLRADEVNQSIGNAPKAIADYQAGIAENTKSRKATKDAPVGEQTKKTSTANWLEYEAIRAGTPMYFRIDLAEDATEAHVGMMLLALRDLVRDQALGGKVSNGRGKFTANLKLVNGNGGLPVFDNEQAGEGANLNPALKNYVKSAQDGIAACTYKGIVEFFTPREQPEDEAA